MNDSLYKVYLHIENLNEIELFSTHGLTHSAEIKEQIVKLIGAKFHIINQSVQVVDVHTLSFEIAYPNNVDSLRNAIQKIIFSIDSEIEVHLLLGIAQIKNTLDKHLADKRALYDLQLHKLKLYASNKQIISNNFDEAILSYDLEKAMPLAFEKGEFYVVYQPIVTAEGAEGAGMEALLRWKHNGQLIPPLKFIKIAERSTFIYKLTLFVLNNALQLLKDYPELLFISINLSPVTLSNINWLTKYRDNCNPRDLSFFNKIAWEITENIKLNKDHWSSIKALKEKGHLIFLDDFGAGQTCFKSLFEAIDTVKLDKSLLQAAVHQKNKDYFFKSIINICFDLNLNVVIEGVETREEFDYLQQYNTQLQGFYIAKPLPKNEIDLGGLYIGSKMLK